MRPFRFFFFKIKNIKLRLLGAHSGFSKYTTSTFPSILVYCAKQNLYYVLLTEYGSVLVTISYLSRPLDTRDREAGDQNADVSVALDSKGRQQLNVALRCLLPLRTFSPFRKYEPIGSSAKTQKI